MAKEIKDSKSKKTVYIFSVIGILIICISVAGFYYYSKRKASNIKTIEIQRQNLKDIIDVSGTVESEKDINIRSVNNGLVVKRNVEENIKLKMGQTIIEIDPQLSKLQLNQAVINANNLKIQSETEIKNAQKSLEDAKARQEINFKNLDNQINKVKSNIEFLETELKRNQILLNSGAIPKQTVDNQKQQLEQAKIDLKTSIDNFNRAKNEKGEIITAQNRLELSKVSLKNAIKQGEASISIANDSLKKTVITAPFKGTITQWEINKGDYVTSGTNIARFQDLEDIKLKLPLNELDLPKVSYKSPVTIVFDAYPDKIYKGLITWISESSTVDNNNVQVFPVKVSFDNKEKLIKPGMSGDAQITISEKKNVISIPLNTIIKKENKIFVKVLIDGNIEEKEINAGISTLDYLEVKSGLKQGDKIVLEEEKKK